MPAKRFTAILDTTLPILAIDMGYSAKTRSCGLARSGTQEVSTLYFGECIQATLEILQSHGPHTLILEAVLSTYHRHDGNPDIRGDFEKGRGWYYGPGVSTYAGAMRFLEQLNERLPDSAHPLPLVEGFLSYKKTRTEHTEDARRMIDEFDSAELFTPAYGSEAISSMITGIPVIKRYNKPIKSGIT